MIEVLRTLNRRNDPKDIEKRFDAVRHAYQRDLYELRKKYAEKFIQLSVEYGSACILK